MFKRTTIAAALAAALALPALFTPAAHAAVIYYDTNGATAGTGATPNDWNSGNTVWTTDSTGTSATIAWPASGTGNLDGSDVVFSAGTNAPAAYDINIAGTKISNSITVNNGAITLHLSSATNGSATRVIGPGGITLNQPDPSPATPFTFRGVTTGTGSFAVNLSASQTWTNNSGANNAVTFTPITTAGTTGTMKLSGTATTGNSQTLTLAGSANGVFAFGVPVTDGTAGGTLAITTAKKVNFTNALSTFSGGYAITAATTTLDNGGGLTHANINISGGSLVGGTTGTGGSITDNISNDAAEEILLSSTGTLDLTNLNLTVLPTGTQSLPEYILANAPVGSPNILGTSFATTNLPAGWSINYTGTVANPNAIVLIAAATPEPTSLAVLALGASAMLMRRRK